MDMTTYHIAPTLLAPATVCGTRLGLERIPVVTRASWDSKYATHPTARRALEARIGRTLCPGCAQGVHAGDPMPAPCQPASAAAPVVGKPLSISWANGRDARSRFDGVPTFTIRLPEGSDVGASLAALFNRKAS